MQLDVGSHDDDAGLVAEGALRELVGDLEPVEPAVVPAQPHDRPRAGDRGGEGAKGRTLGRDPCLADVGRHVECLVPAAQEEGGQKAPLPGGVDDSAREIEAPGLRRVVLGLVEVPVCRRHSIIMWSASLRSTSRVAVRGAFRSRSSLSLVCSTAGAVPPLLPVAGRDRVERGLQDGEVARLPRPARARPGRVPPSRASDRSSRRAMPHRAGVAPGSRSRSGFVDCFKIRRLSTRTRTGLGAAEAQAMILKRQFHRIAERRRNRGGLEAFALKEAHFEHAACTIESSPTTAWMRGKLVPRFERSSVVRWHVISPPVERGFEKRYRRER